MSEPDNFLSRWSRRKLEPSKESGEPVAPETKQPADAQPAGVEPQPPAASVPAQDPPFDPASLPPIESITVGTDIRDFLKPGVPLSLSRAALRRAWTSDPAIRDFVGLAENQWDFTNDSIPGFGPLDPADVPRLLARIIESGNDVIGSGNDGTEAASDVAEASVTQRNASAADTSENDASVPAREQLASGESPDGDPSRRNRENDATQNSDADGHDANGKLNYAHLRHGHGSALPD
jgi:hypothetical protein